MSTRSFIGYYDSQSQLITYIYCHHDGYPSYNGQLLYTYYTSLDKILELLSLGNLSCLGQNIGIARPFDIATNLQDLNIYQDQDEAQRHAKIENTKFEADREVLDLIQYLKTNSDVQILHLMERGKVFKLDGYFYIPLTKNGNYKSVPALRLCFARDLDYQLQTREVEWLEKNFNFLVTHKNLTWHKILEIINCINSCLCYGRDRGEKNQEAKTDSLTQFYKSLADSWCEYTYLLKDGRWLMYEHGAENEPSLEKFRPLEPKDFED